jgi:hypothetical protein
VDSEAAYYHFRVAAIEGGSEASKLVDRDLGLLSSQLGQSRTEAIDLNANEWYKKHGSDVTFVGNDEKSRRQFAVISGAGGHVAELVTSPAL